MKKYFLFCLMNIAIINANQELIDKQEEVIALQQKIEQRKQMVLQAWQDYEEFYNKIITKIVSEIGEKNEEEYKEELDDLMEELWLLFKKGEFENICIKNLDAAQSKNLIYLFFKVGILNSSLEDLEINWLKKAQELIKLKNS